VLELPTDRPRPPFQTFLGAQKGFVISQGLNESLHLLSRREDVTLFMTLLAAFQTLLLRYSGQDDIAVGSPIANRNRVEVEGMIGFFVNTLVLRTDLRGNPSFRELLGRVREVALGGYAHHHIPFEKLVEELNPERNTSHTTLFQVMLVLQNAFGEVPEFPGLSIEPFAVGTDTAKFDLTLYLREDAGGMRGNWEYNTDLFDGPTIERMIGHFLTLLEGIVVNPDLRLSALPLLTEAERYQLLVEWNDTKRDYPKDKCIHELFEKQVERTPDAIALIFEDQQLTYRELNRRVNQLAHYLRKHGVGPEVLVGICMERSLEMVIGLLGILKAGGAYVPLDPAYPKERLAFMLEDARVPILLTQEGQLSTMPEYNGHVICLDRDCEKLSRESEVDPVSGVNPGNLAYVIYTSGSTGKPKGVQISHRAVVNFLFSMLKEPGLSENDVLLSVTTLSFDIAALELFLPLITGARTVLVSREMALDGSQLLKRLKEGDATVMQATPATWRLLLEAGWHNKIGLKMLCGGEALPRDLASQLLERGESLWNMYGPTETTIWSMVYRIESKASPMLIGRPIANTQIYILDRNFQLVPVGVAGELCIGGEGLARGYLNRPELTAEKFIEDPFSAVTGARLYRTGDLVRYLPDGNIEFLGRIDHQVKIRGFRIELGEIESVLEQHEAVKEAVVMPREDIPGEKRLVAYLVPNGKQTPSVSLLRQYLKEKLPDYMVPNAFVMLEKFPLTPNGKVDRKALPSPTGLRPELESNYVAPQAEIDRTIAAIWQEVLRLEKIGIHDNFFQVG
jgi:amino acid adenylation domain-containing protein